MGIRPPSSEPRRSGVVIDPLPPAGRFETPILGGSGDRTGDQGDGGDVGGARRVGPGDPHAVAGSVGADGLLEGVRGADARAADAGDLVTGGDPGAGGGGAGVGTLHRRAGAVPAEPEAEEGRRAVDVAGVHGAVLEVV